MLETFSIRTLIFLYKTASSRWVKRTINNRSTACVGCAGVQKVWKVAVKKQGCTFFIRKTQLGSTERTLQWYYKGKVFALFHQEFPYCNYCIKVNKLKATGRYRLSRKGQMKRDWKNWNNLIPTGIHERQQDLYWNMAFLQKVDFWALFYFTVLYLGINTWIKKIKSRYFKISNYIMNICP